MFKDSRVKRCNRFVPLFWPLPNEIQPGKPSPPLSILSSQTQPQPTFLPTGNALALGVDRKHANDMPSYGVVTESETADLAAAVVRTSLRKPYAASCLLAVGRSHTPPRQKTTCICGALCL